MRKIKITTFIAMFLAQMNLFGQNTPPRENIYNSGTLYINGKPQTELTKASFTKSVMGNCDTIFSFLTPTDYPFGVVWDGKYLWHSCGNNSNIYKLDTLGNLLDSIIMPHQIGGMEYDSTYLYAVSEQASLYYKIDISNYSYTAHSLPTFYPSDPNTWGVTYGNGLLWFSEYGASYDIKTRIYKINLFTNSVLDTIFVNSNLILGIQWIDNFIYGMEYSQPTLFLIHNSVMRYGVPTIKESLKWGIKDIVTH